MILITMGLTGCVTTSYDFELSKEYDISTSNIRPNVRLNVELKEYRYNNAYTRYDDSLSYNSELIAYNSKGESDYTAEIRSKTILYNNENKQDLLDRDDILEIEKRDYIQAIDRYRGGTITLNDSREKSSSILDLLWFFSLGIIPSFREEKQNLEIVIHDNKTGLNVVKPIGTLTRTAWIGWIPLFIPNGDGVKEAFYEKNKGISENILHHINAIVAEKEKEEEKIRQEKIEADRRKKEESQKRKQEQDNLLKRFKTRTNK